MELAYPKPQKKPRKGLKISKLDALFSKYIRTRDKWTCQRCSKKFTPPTQALHCSHYFGRGKKSVRFDPGNADALCYGCHHYWEKEDREGYRVFKINQLGQRGYDLLTLYAMTPQKPDTKLLTIYFTKLLEELEQKERI